MVAAPVSTADVLADLEAALAQTTTPALLAGLTLGTAASAWLEEVIADDAEVAALAGRLRTTRAACDRLKSRPTRLRNRLQELPPLLALSPDDGTAEALTGELARIVAELPTLTLQAAIAFRAAAETHLALVRRLAELARVRARATEDPADRRAAEAVVAATQRVCDAVYGEAVELVAFGHTNRTRPGKSIAYDVNPLAPSSWPKAIERHVAREVGRIGNL
jgi:hypothetical protein